MWRSGFPGSSQKTSPAQTQGLTQNFQALWLWDSADWWFSLDPGYIQSEKNLSKRLIPSLKQGQDKHSFSARMQKKQLVEFEVQHLLHTPA